MNVYLMKLAAAGFILPGMACGHADPLSAGFEDKTFHPHIRVEGHALIF